MPVPGVGEPQEALLTFDMNDVVPLAPGPAANSVVQAGQDVSLRVDLGLTGAFTGLLFNEAYRVFHHLERVEDGDRKTLSGGTFNVPGNAADAAAFSATTGPYSTGEFGSGADFEIGDGFEAGTFRILTDIHLVDLGKGRMVTAFHDMIFMVA